MTGPNLIKHFGNLRTLHHLVEKSVEHFGWKSMEQRTLKNVNDHLNTNFYSYLETSGVQSSNLYLNVVHFFKPRVN